MIMIYIIMHIANDNNGTMYIYNWKQEAFVYSRLLLKNVVIRTIQ